MHSMGVMLLLIGLQIFMPLLIATAGQRRAGFDQWFP